MMKRLTHLSLTVTLMCLGLSACSSSPANDSQSPTSIAGIHVDEKTLFADIRELDQLPADEDYLLGTGDSVNISVFQADEFSKVVKVGTDGNISLPLLGDMRAKGLTTPQLKQAIVTRLKQKYLQDPQVTITLQEQQNRSITLDGAFTAPGIRPLTGSQISLLQAVSLGSGLTDLADAGKVILFRHTGDKIKAYHLDINAIRDGRMKDPYVRNNDVIVAHRSDSRYWLQQTASLLGNFTTIFTAVGTMGSTVTTVKTTF
jgi:polysaccharide export outer membrane protein